MTTQPTNFCALTLTVRDVTESKSGKATIANALVEKIDLPVRIVALNGVRKWLKAGQPVTLIGRLAYEERDGAGAYLLYPQKAEKTPAGKSKNVVKLTLRLGQDPTGAYTESGRFWARVRAFLSQGKTETGAYKPALWLTVKGFARDGDESLPAALSALNKGDLVTVTGRLAYEVYQERGFLTLVASRLEAFHFAEEEAEPELTGEPD